MAKLYRQRWEERLEINDVVEFDSKLLKTNTKKGSSAKSFYNHYLAPTIQTSVKFREFAISSVAFDVSLSNLASYSSGNDYLLTGRISKL